MKRFLIFCLSAFCLLSAKAETITVSGKIVSENSTVIELSLSRAAVGGMFMQPEPVTVGEGKYTLTLDCTAPCFATLYGTLIDSRNDIRQISLPVYLTPEHKKTKMDIVLSEKKAPEVKTKDRNMKALAEFNQLFYTHYLTRSLPTENIKPFLSKFSDTAKDIIAHTRCDKEVGEYIEIWAYAQIFDYMNQLYHMNRRNELVLATLKEVKAGLPKEEEIFDNGTAMLRPGVAQHVRQSLKGSTIEEVLADLHRKYSDKTVISEVERFLFERYILSYDYNKDAQKGYERLKQMTRGNDMSDIYLERFRLRTNTVIGSDAPEAVFVDAEGNERKFSDFKGKYLYVDFWASWCIPCVNEIPHLLDLKKNLQNKNVEFIGISIDSDREAWVKKMQQLNLSGNQFIIKDNLLAEMLNIRGVPFFVIYDKNGKLLKYDAPRPSNGELKDILESLQ